MTKTEKGLVTAETTKEINKLQLEVAQVTRTKSLLNPNQIQKLWNRTPLRFQYSREGRGGQKFTYVRKGYVKRVLDSVFGFNWSFHKAKENDLAMILAVAEKTGTVVIEGYLECVVVDDRGNVLGTLHKADAGSVSVKFKKEVNKETGRKELLDFGNDVKGAYTDCLKRCAQQLGIAADVYDPNEFMDIEIIGSEESSNRKKNLNKQIEKAKAELDSEAEEVPNDK